jgi:hypothetical protein
MVRSDGSAALSVERFFQFSLLGLVASGFLAVAGSGYLDVPTIGVAVAGLLLRAALIAGLVPWNVSDRSAMMATLAYGGLYALDCFVLSRDFLTATVHLVFFLAVMKILMGRTNRDHLYTAAISFVALVAAAIISTNFNFFLFLACYMTFAVAALTSSEIRLAMSRGVPHPSGVAARGGLRRFHLRLSALSASVTLGILALTAGLFFLLPRTADAAFRGLFSQRLHVAGFSDQVTLGETGVIRTTSRPVMHISVFSADLPPGLKWRGGALTDFDGKRWSNPNHAPQRIPVKGGQAELETASNRPQWRAGISYAVTFDDLATHSLFFAGFPQRVYLRDLPLSRTEGDGYRVGGFAPVRYEAYSLLEAPPETAPARFPAPVLSLAERERYLQIPTLDKRIPALAREVTSQSETDLARARALEHYLRTQFGYSLQLPDREQADPLADFLFSRKKGHCEYFASAMAVMLRALGVPARLATGFQSGVYNPLSELWVVRASDAHTWVEAWMPGQGWSTFDPTPPDPGDGFPLLARMNLYLDAAQTFWRQWVVGYDSGQQGSLIDKLQVVRRLWNGALDSAARAQSGWELHAAWLRRAGLAAALSLFLLVWLWALLPRVIRRLQLRMRFQRVRRGHASAGDATLLYGRMLEILRRHGYQKPAWFTPEEFADSLPEGVLRGVVSEFTDRYNAIRFGGRTETAPLLPALLERLEQAPVRR